ncbi:MAG: hypothetical protein WBD02_06250 [Acidimicrobiia bacterium]
MVTCALVVSGCSSDGAQKAKASAKPMSVEQFCDALKTANASVVPTRKGGAPAPDSLDAIVLRAPASAPKAFEAYLQLLRKHVQSPALELPDGWYENADEEGRQDRLAMNPLRFKIWTWTSKNCGVHDFLNPAGIRNSARPEQASIEADSTSESSSSVPIPMDVRSQRAESIRTVLLEAEAIDASGSVSFLEIAFGGGQPKLYGTANGFANDSAVRVGCEAVSANLAESENSEESSISSLDFNIDGTARAQWLASTGKCLYSDFHYPATIEALKAEQEEASWWAALCCQVSQPGVDVLLVKDGTSSATALEICRVAAEYQFGGRVDGAQEQLDIRLESDVNAASLEELGSPVASATSANNCSG